MRKITFIDQPDETKKLMIYKSSDGIYLFGYDCVQDSASAWDIWFENLDEAYEYCIDKYNIDINDWIIISDPIENCQHDFILPTKVKGKDQGEPKWGQFQKNVNSNWIDIDNNEKYLDFNGLTGNERLFISGLIYEFENAKLVDKTNAIKILKLLKFDNDSILKII